MRAITGGVVVGVEEWSYTDKDTEQSVAMQTVWIQGSARANDSIAVPAALGTPEVGSEVYYDADFSIRRGRAKTSGGNFPDSLSVWARAECASPYVEVSTSRGRKSAA